MRTNGSVPPPDVTAEDSMSSRSVKHAKKEMVTRPTVIR
jgi:hypothetical protein